MSKPITQPTYQFEHVDSFTKTVTTDEIRIETDLFIHESFADFLEDPTKDVHL